MQSTFSTVHGRTCGNCTLCCKVLSIVELKKPSGTWCAHCKPGSGCTIHADRPQECADFFCGYLTSPDLGEEWNPAEAKLVIAAELNGGRVLVHVDPARPDAWKHQPYYLTLKRIAKGAAQSGGHVFVWVGQRLHVVFADNDVDLGVVTKDELVQTYEQMTPSGRRWHAAKFHRDDPRIRGQHVRKWGEPIG